MVVVPHISVFVEEEQTVGPGIADLPRGNLLALRNRETLLGTRLRMLANQRLRDAVKEPQPLLLVDKNRNLQRRGSAHGAFLAVDDVGLALVVAQIDSVAGVMVVGVVLVGFDERQVLVAFGARNHIQFEVGAQPVQVAVVYAEDVALQLERCGVDGQRTVEDALNHNLPLLLHRGLVEILVAGEQQHVAVAGLLNLYHLHVLRNLLQLVVHLIVVVGILVVEIEPVVHVANP